jgi:hypothetical protein
VIKHIRPNTASADHDNWRELGDAAEVELTSEDAEWPVEGALLNGRTRGWRAGAPGPQTIRVSWATPIPIRRIRLVFEEHVHARTQEFALRAITPQGAREIVRQQFTFAPPGTTIEREEYTTDLDDVAGLELLIVPAIGGGGLATLQEWRIA